MRPSTFLDKSKEMLDTTLFAIPEGAYVHNPSLEIPEGSTEQKKKNLKKSQKQKLQLKKPKKLRKLLLRKRNIRIPTVISDALNEIGPS